MDVKSRRFFWAVTGTLLLLALLPYGWTWAKTPPGYQYVGIVYNPLDAASYLAKMRLGWVGEWRFRLMFTPEPQSGAYLYLFHLALGHLARLLHWPLAVVYHGVRGVGGLALLGLLWRLAGLAAWGPRSRRWGFWLAAIAGGLGWLPLAFNPPPVDLWVPEGYAFYSILANAHFPWAQALLIVVMLGVTRLAATPDRSWLPALVIGGGLLLLGVLQPFAVAEAGLVWAVWLVLEGLAQRRIPWRLGWQLGVVGTLGLIYPLYGVWAIRHDPVLAAWDAQNLTASPPWWNWVVGYAWLLPLASVGAVRAWRRRTALDRLLIAWVVGIVIGIALPLSLQRRFCLGASLPLGLLAGAGWETLLTRARRGRLLINSLAVALTGLTPLILLAGGCVGTLPADPRFYVTTGEAAAARPLLAAGGRHVTLASPERGMLLPALTGQPVVVGHPFETVMYEQRLAAATAFFRPETTAEARRALLCREGVDYVWVGPLERTLLQGAVLDLPVLRPLVQNTDVVVYAVAGACD